MRPNNCVKLIRLGSKASDLDETMFDAAAGDQDATRRYHLKRTLERENALLEAVASETRADIVRLRLLLDAGD